MALTSKREKFCQSVASGLTQADAYRSAFDCSRMKNETVQNTASRLMRIPEVSARVDELRKPIVEKVGLTLEAHLKRLDDLSRKAEEKSNYGPAVSAEVARGKAAGLYVEKVEHTGNVTIVASQYDEML